MVRCGGYSCHNATNLKCSESPEAIHTFMQLISPGQLERSRKATSKYANAVTVRILVTITRSFRKKSVPIDGVLHACVNPYECVLIIIIPCIGGGSKKILGYSWGSYDIYSGLKLFTM